MFFVVVMIITFNTKLSNATDVHFDIRKVIEKKQHRIRNFQ